jgi:hypothetical protein
MSFLSKNEKASTKIVFSDGTQGQEIVSFSVLARVINKVDKSDIL